jgi:hypothetical protein
MRVCAKLGIETKMIRTALGSRFNRGSLHRSWRQRNLAKPSKEKDACDCQAQPNQAKRGPFEHNFHSLVLSSLTSSFSLTARGSNLLAAQLLLRINRATSFMLGSFHVA